jgi:HK97 family phage major capsid protein
MNRPFPILPTDMRYKSASSFVRTIIAMAAAKGNAVHSYELAASRWGADSTPATVLKAAVPAMGTAAGASGAELVAWEGAAAEYFALVRERTLLGRMAGIRRVPLRTRMVTQATGTTASWVGEGKAVPVSSGSYLEDNMAPLKVCALSVITEELAESSDPAAEAVVREDLLVAMAAAIDLTFIDPANAGTAGVKPASITNGATSSASAGIDSDAIWTDLEALISNFEGELERAYFVASPLTLSRIALRLELSKLGARGGAILGIPALPSKAAEGSLILIDPATIIMGASEVDVRVSTQATIEMQTAPTANSLTGSGTTAVNLWQTNSVGIMVGQGLNFERAQPGVSLVTGVAY